MKILGTVEGSRSNMIIYRFHDVFIIKHPKGLREEAIKLFERKFLKEDVEEVPKHDLILFGKPYLVKEREGKESVSLKNETIIVQGKSKADRLKALENVIKVMLIRKIREIFSEFSSFGFKVAKNVKVTRSLGTLASVRGDHMKISMFCAGMPILSLKALLSHETAHLYFPDHGEKFLRKMMEIFPEVLEVESPIDSFKRHFAMSVSFLEIATSSSLWIYV